jgi:tetratricopeptide (TPR) repeat protein
MWAAGSLLSLAGIAAAYLGLIVWPAAELREAEEALRRNDAAAAHARLERYLACWPKDLHALFLAAQAARRCDACADAERHLTAFEQASGSTEASRLEWALLGVQQGNFAEDEGGLRSAVSHNHPESPAIGEALAKGYHAAYRFPEALMVLEWLIERVPDHAPALILRGTILDKLRQTDKALADFRKAVNLAPNSPVAHAALAGALNHLGYSREAIYHYELALRLRPADPEALLGLSRALADAAELTEAEQRLDALLAADPNHANGLVERGRLALRQGKPAQAEPFLARGVGLAPWHRDGQQLYLMALKELGRTSEALQAEARVAELREADGVGGRLKQRARDSLGDAAVRWDLWLWCRRNGLDEEGFGWLVQLLRVAPRHAEAHAALADHFDLAGQPRRAALHRSAAGQ